MERSTFTMVRKSSIFLFFRQTGTAEKFCNLLEEEARKNLFQPTVHDLKNYDHEELKSGVLSVFLMATHGNL